MAKKVKPPSPSELRMRLGAPGMTILHRAGLGGLACTLRYVQRAYECGVLWDDDVPGVPWAAFDKPPWELREDEIVLLFGQPEGAREYLKRLFRIAFGLKDGLICLPGQYGDLPPSLAVRAEIQAGLTLTFLQHGKTRDLEKQSLTHEVDPTGDGTSLVTIEYRPCKWYKHQDGWEELIDEDTGCLSSEPVEVIGPLNPGAVVRHVAFTSATKIEEPAARALPLYFALVGCLALPINRGAGVLVAPDVENLRDFTLDRPLMTPASVRECRVGGASDAALQAEVRLRTRGLIDRHDLPATHASRFVPTTWASQQKSRVETLTCQAATVHRWQPPREAQLEKALRLFEVALASLPPRVLQPKAEAKGDGPRATFWIDSKVRPLIADNLARGESWYRDFASLMRGKAESERLGFEKKGLQDMIETMTDDPKFTNERTLIEAIHEAIRLKRRRIKQETQGDVRAKTTKATSNRQARFMERVRLSLVGAKTAEQCRAAIVKDLLAQVVFNAKLQTGYAYLLPLLHVPKRWQEARDLALLALASYGTPRPQTTPSDAETEQ
jgi:CRISPR-associated protein Cas8a1/Csx13